MMVARNPNSATISTPLWDLWTGFDALEPTAVLGGIYARKSGYHNVRSALPGSDYSVHDVAADRLGPSHMSAGIDLTMSSAAMRRYTARLDKAARARDPRLFPPGKPPVLREFIGTLDGRTVYCYMLTGGIPQGVGRDAGPDWGRDSSHLWHLHLSIIRAYLQDRAALAGVLSVLKGEPPPTSTIPKPSPTDGDKDVQWTDTVKYLTGKAVKYAQESAPLSSFLTSLHYYTVLARDEATKARQLGEQAAGQLQSISAAVSTPRSLSEGDVARVAEAVAARIGINPGQGSAPTPPPESM